MTIPLLDAYWAGGGGGIAKRKREKFLNFSAKQSPIEKSIIEWFLSEATFREIVKETMAR